MEEHRQTQRQRTLKGARIVFNDGRSTLECTVRNLSSGGAQLRIAMTLGIPDAFELRLSDDTRHQCTVAWRKADELGVKFL
jgi:hypothetical protein